MSRRRIRAYEELGSLPHCARKDLALVTKGDSCADPIYAYGDTHKVRAYLASEEWKNRFAGNLAIKFNNPEERRAYQELLDSMRAKPISDVIMGPSRPRRCTKDAQTQPK